MKAKWILAACFVIVSSAIAHAGGPPPMYVVVDKVVFEPNRKVPNWVQIWGSFTRQEKAVDKAGKETVTFSKPIYGYVFLSLPESNDKALKEELKEWQKAAGSGKAVAVGSCNDAGCMLKCPIHLAKETAVQPAAAYTTGILKRFGDVYANNEFVNYPEVKALLKFSKKRK